MTMRNGELLCRRKIPLGKIKRKVKLNSCICEFTKYLLLMNGACDNVGTIFVFAI